MKSIVAFLASILFLTMVVSPVISQQATTSSPKPTSITEKREVIKERIAQERAQASESAKQRRAIFKERVAQIKDQRKKATVERVQQRLDQINQKRTDQMGEFLDRLEKMVAKIETRIAKAKANGKDVSKAEAALTEAKAALNAAKTAVEAQAGKSYVITISDESGLRNAVGQVSSSLQKDLRETRKIVTEAKQAVGKVMSLIKEVKGVEND